MHTNIGVALKPNFISSSCRVLNFLKYAFSSITLKILNLLNLNKSLKIFAFNMFSLKYCLHPDITC